MIETTELNYSIVENNVQFQVIVEETTNNVIETGFVALTINNNNSVLDITMEAGENIGGHKIVYMNDNKAFIADANNNDCLNKVLGITINASNEGDLINIRKLGLISTIGWNLIPNSNYFLGVNGALSLSPNLSIYQNIGYALDADTFFIDMQLPIKRV